MLAAAGQANAVAFSPDGDLLALAREWAIELVDADTGQVLRVLHGHTGGVWGVAFSPDGALLATAGDDGTARIWDVATGTTRTTLTGHTDGVRGVAFSPDGALLATAGADGTARIWDVATGTTRTTLTGHTGGVLGVAFSPDGTLLATAGTDRTARIWDVADPLLTTLLGLSRGRRGYATLLPDGAYKLEGDPTGRLWWAVTLCRFEPTELDPYDPPVRRLDPAEPVVPIARSRPRRLDRPARQRSLIPTRGTHNGP